MKQRENTVLPPSLKIMVQRDVTVNEQLASAASLFITVNAAVFSRYNCSANDRVLVKYRPEAHCLRILVPFRL